jgi:hypothetical protein
MVTASDFVKIIRAGNDKLRVEKVVVVTPENKFGGTGTLRIKPEKIEIDLTVKKGEAPPLKKRVVTKKDRWKLSGLIDGHLRFVCDNVSPGGSSRGFNGSRTIIRELRPIELVTEPFSLVKARRKRIALERAIGLKPSPLKEYEPKSFSFEATFVDCELPAANGGTETIRNNDFLGEGKSSSLDTFSGELSHSRYGIVRNKNERDLNVYLRSKPEFISLSEEDDRRKFRSFLDALAFVTGVQPWPFWTKYERGSYRISEEICAAEPPPRTNHSPFSRDIGLQESKAFGDAVRAAADFLEPDTVLNKKLRHLLFLFRQAGSKNVQLEITILSISVLLESLMRTIFKHVCSGKSAAEDALDPIEFENMKSNFLRRVERMAKKRKGPAYDRLWHGIKGASVFQTQDMFKAVAQELKIPWVQMQRVFNEWKRARNPSAHGDFRHEIPEGVDEQKTVEEMFFGLSRIAGGFNMVLLRLFGYSGVYRDSAFKDDYRRM